jgi:hypothetical protein
MDVFLEQPVEVFRMAPERSADGGVHRFQRGGTGCPLREERS